MIVDQKAYECWKSIGVRRWHNKPSVPSQPIGMHQMGMLVLLEYLHPNPTASLMRAIIRHDLSEKIGCDFPGPMKREYPVLAEIDQAKHVEFEDLYEFDKLTLTDAEKLWVEFLDQLEPMFYLTSIHYMLDDEGLQLFLRIGERVNELTKRLQAFGYMTEPTETVH